MDLISFNNNNIIALKKDEKIYIAISNVCDYLGIDKASQKRKIKNSKLYEGGVIMSPLTTAGGIQDTMMLEKKYFQHWLSSISLNKVLDIHQDLLYKYQIECVEVIDNYFNKTNKIDIKDNEQLIDITEKLIYEYKLEKQKRIDAENKIEIYKPVYDSLLTEQSDRQLNIVAKELNVGPNNLYKLLRNKKVLFINAEDRNVPYQSYIDLGYFKISHKNYKKEKTDDEGNKTKIKIGYSLTLITPKGVAWLIGKLKEWKVL